MSKEVVAVLTSEVGLPVALFRLASRTTVLEDSQELGARQQAISLCCAHIQGKSEASFKWKVEHV